MKRFFVDFLLVSIPLLSLVGITNFTADPAHKFDNDYENIILEILQSNLNATNVDNCSERHLKSMLIESNRGKHYDYAVFGSSRSMTLSSKEMKVNIINLGVSGATIMDLIALQYLADSLLLSFDNVIIVLDPYVFYEKKQDIRWEENKNLFLSATNNSDSDNLSFIADYFQGMANLFSASYFQASIKYLEKGVNNLESVSSIDNKGQTICVDGSISYPQSIREMSQADIDKSADQHKDFVLYDYKDVSLELVSLFEMLISRFDDKKIIIFKAPMHPIVWNKIKNIQGIQSENHLIDRLASKYNCTVLGSFDPALAHVNNRAFYDATHMRRELINDIVRNHVIN